MRESDIQKQIMQKLTGAGWLCIKLMQTNWNGIPDVMALKNGKSVFIEVKQPGKTPNDLQKYRHEKLRGQGFDVIVATSVNDIFFLLPVKESQQL